MIQFHPKVDPYDRGHRPYDQGHQLYDHGHQPYAEPHYQLEGRAPDTYYIVPAGTSVIFQDEDGNEITRYELFSGLKPSCILNTNIIFQSW
jgi:hypothetical protein